MKKNLKYAADLHVHCRRSDGSEEARDILQQARDLGLTHLVFTDHDTAEGAERMVELAKEYGILSVSGIEISAFDFEAGIKAHILGYGFHTAKHIEKVSRPTLVRRDENCVKQIEVLQDLGFEIDVEAVRSISGSWMYKQHILDFLVQSGQETELFGRVYREIFRNGGPCDFGIPYADAEAAVSAIREDGGFAVLAHPGQQNNLYLVKRLVSAGLSGIELNHPSNGPDVRRDVLQVCEEYGLFASGGSDFHGRYEKSSRLLGAHLAAESSRIIFEKF